MSQRIRIIAATLADTLFGITICGVGVYYIFIQPVLEGFARAEYYSTVAEATLTVSRLRLLREGKVEVLADFLEADLNDTILRASRYEETSPHWRDSQVENSISRIREYRLKYPLSISDKAFHEQVVNALAPRSRATTPP